MALEQPIASTPLFSPSHSALHRIIAADATAPAKSITVIDGGNVGVGYDIPISKLSICGGIYQPEGVGLQTNVYYDSGWKYAADGRAYTQYSTGSGFYRYSVFNNNTGGSGVAATEIIAMSILQSNGYLGFGTDAPLTKLHIVTNLDHIRLSQNEVDGDNGYTSIISSQNAKTAEPEGYFIAGGYYSVSANEVRIGGGVSGVNAATDIHFFTAANVSTRTGTERLTILNSGVGINEINPAGALEIKSTYSTPHLLLTDANISQSYLSILGLPADSFFAVQEVTNGNGGAKLTGYTEDTGTAGLHLIGVAASESQTVGAIRFGVATANGSSILGVASDDIAYEFQNGVRLTPWTMLRMMGSGYVAVGDITPAFKFSVGSTDKLQQIGLYHDNSDGIVTWTEPVGTGGIKFMTSVTDNDSKIKFVGNGTGRALFDIYGYNSTHSMHLSVDATHSHISSVSLPLSINYSGASGIELFKDSASGITTELKISGYRTGDNLKTLEIGVGIDADDTASFDGVGNYLFDGTIKAGAFFFNTIPTEYVDDASAASGGLAVGGVYRTGSILKVRVS